MSHPELVSIHISPRGGEPMQPLQEVEAVAGKGLAGDRYLLNVGTYSKRASPHRQVTLMETEVFTALKRDHDIELSYNESRRNLITRGVPLPHLVGEVFYVGPVKFRGLLINEPCAYFEKLVSKPGIEAALLHRSGINAEVLEGGTLHVGDKVTYVSSE